MVFDVLIESDIRKYSELAIRESICGIAHIDIVKTLKMSLFSLKYP